jgi:hypothetical protein
MTRCDEIGLDKRGFIGVLNGTSWLVNNHKLMKYVMARSITVQGMVQESAVNKVLKKDHELPCTQFNLLIKQPRNEKEGNLV